MGPVSSSALGSIWRSGTPRPGPSRRPSSTPPPPRSPRAWPPTERLSEMATRAYSTPTLSSRDLTRANLVYMPTEHQPVLAAELIDLLAPEPGETAVDCTFGAGGHARLLAEALGPDGTLICIDRDPGALARYEAFTA